MTQPTPARAETTDPASPQRTAALHGLQANRASSPVGRRRTLLGLRKRPGRLALAVFRLPLGAARAGRLPGRTFVTFVHTGRVTGQPHEAVAMVLRHDEATREVVVCAAWGPDTDWVRNLRAGPATSVRLGKESFVPDHRFLSPEEALDVLRSFRSGHPARLRLFSAVLGWGDLRSDDAARDFVHSHPFIAFRPSSGPGSSGSPPRPGDR
jgi:deazaflavin-dependent oxidoreductase (nitroreductase family)